MAKLQAGGVTTGITCISGTVPVAVAVPWLLSGTWSGACSAVMVPASPLEGSALPKLKQECIASERQAGSGSTESTSWI